jgi:hypothetical protein
MKLQRMLFAMAAVAALATSVSVASAQSNDPRVERRELRQHARIEQGIRRGELTRGESWRLRAGQGHVRRMERRAHYDNRLTPRERARLERAQDRQSRRIARMEHNRRTI